LPELPDLLLYLHALQPRVAGQALLRIRLLNPFLLRTVDPPLDTFLGRTVRTLGRLGKRIVWELDEDLFLVFHLMIAGRFRWIPAGGRIPAKVGLAAFDFPTGTLVLTEAGSKRRASLQAVRGRLALEALDPGGLEVLETSQEDFINALTCENHTLKRSLTDPHIFSGIGNAYSDEILHAARLSPFKQTRQLTVEEMERLWIACRQVLPVWIVRLQEETGDRFPERVTAFREGMAVHGRYEKPCPVCGTSVQRITRRTNRITAPPARRAAGSWPIVPSRACSNRTGPGRWTSSSSASMPRADSSPAPEGTVLFSRP
jgi:formamidopyrimidine-DNA glycosylase